MFLHVCSANAETLFDNLGPDDTFALEGPGGALGIGVGGEKDFKSGFRFTPAADYLLDSVTAPIVQFPPGGPNPITIELYESGADGLPGELLDSSQSLQVPLILAPSASVFEFAGDTVMKAGVDYFIAARADDTQAIPAAWNFNSTEHLGTNITFSNARSDGTMGWRESEIDLLLAARIEGTLVPEPSSASLLALALPAFARLGRRKRYLEASSHADA
ncbi:MAG: PEP-CTERM sorting domain-containing protein [Pirellulaceae bacterium]|nr:PEP-CTERM sorting domain-containing protein [Planctomycetales bacterium]